ncbi:MAG: sulfotransferase [Deltaproteobacteria bacterium]|nr:sulfotransferase [Deltaproteobacteria bacterium]
MSRPLPLPWPARALNGLGRASGRLGFPVRRFEPERLLAAACRATGLDDFGETDFREGLTRLCASLEGDAHLSAVGRLGLWEQVVGSLATRLHRVAARRDPKRKASGLVAPLIVVGLPRSGTTHLHRLLAHLPDARALRYFEVRHPLAAPGPDRRREQTARELARIKRLVPDLDAKHFIDVDEPEECIFLLASSLRSPSFWMLAPVYGYLEWLRTADLAPAYSTYREHLELFQAESPGSRLTLKAPAHTRALGELATALPEACFVQTHRDPLPVIGSVNSLFATFFSLASEAPDLPRMARTNLELLADLVDRADAVRERLGDRVLDVDYDALVAEPVATVERIARHFGLRWDAAAERALEAVAGDREQHRHGKHAYDVAEFGLSRAEVERRFSRYRARHLGENHHDTAE